MMAQTLNALHTHLNGSKESLAKEASAGNQAGRQDARIGHVGLHVTIKVSSLAEFRSFQARVVEKNIPIKFTLNNGVSFAFYFDDPDGHMIEVYWATGDLSHRQPYAQPLDLSQPDEALLEKITATI